MLRLLIYLEAKADVLGGEMEVDSETEVAESGNYRPAGQVATGSEPVLQD